MDEKLEIEIKNGIKKLPLKDRVKAVALNKYLGDKKKCDDDMEKEIREIQRKYDIKGLEIFKKQQEIIDGRTITQEEIANLKDYLQEGEEVKNDDISQQQNSDPINEYWYTCIKNCDMLLSDIKEKDFEALKSLKNVTFERDEKKDDFVIIFTFAPNDFFETLVLKKSFVFENDEEQPSKSIGTEIKWKQGKNLTKKTVKKKQKNKKSGQQRVIEKEVDDESFFNFFKDSQADPSKENEEEDEEEKGPEGQRIDIDFDIARNFLDELIPYSLEYYLGVKASVDEDGDHEFDDEDLDAEEEEEEQQPKNKKKQKHKKSGDKTEKSGSGATEQKPECKQQ